MELFKRRKPKVVPTGKTIDMLRMGWGHNLSFSKEATMDDLDWRSAIWYGSGVSVGDEIIWRGNPDSYVIRSIITKAEHTGNVWDMYFIEGTVTHINDEPVK